MCRAHRKEMRIIFLGSRSCPEVLTCGGLRYFISTQFRCISKKVKRHSFNCLCGCSGRNQRKYQKMEENVVCSQFIFKKMKTGKNKTKILSHQAGFRQLVISCFQERDVARSLVSPTMYGAEVLGQVRLPVALWDVSCCLNNGLADVVV